MLPGTQSFQQRSLGTFVLEQEDDAVLLQSLCEFLDINIFLENIAHKPSIKLSLNIFYLRYPMFYTLYVLKHTFICRLRAWAFTNTPLFVVSLGSPQSNTKLSRLNWLSFPQCGALGLPLSACPEFLSLL